MSEFVRILGQEKGGAHSKAHRRAGVSIGLKIVD
jgi:hypothetical protein